MKIIYFFLIAGLLTSKSKIYGQATDLKGYDLYTNKSSSGTSFPVSSTGIGYSHILSTDVADNKNRLLSYYFATTLADTLGNACSLDATLFRTLAASGTSLSFPAGLFTTIGPFTKNSKEVNFLEIVPDIAKHPNVTNGDIIVSFMNKNPDLAKIIKNIYNATDYGKAAHVSFWSIDISKLSFSTLSDFTKAVKNPKIEVNIGGIQNSVVAFDWSANKLKNLERWAGIGFHEHDLFYSFFASTDLSSYPYFDTINQIRTVVDGWNFLKFSQIGIKANYNGYWSKHFAAALTAKLYYGSSFDDFKSYQLSATNAPINATNSAYYQTNKAVGIYGGSLNGQQSWKARTSISFPYFFDLFTGKDNSFYFLPSYVAYFTPGLTTIHQIDFSINLLSAKYVTRTKGLVSIVQAGGFGCELISGQTAKGLQTPVWYFTAKVDLTKLSTAKGDPVTKTPK